MEEIGAPPQRYVNFRILYIVIQLIGITILILLLSWIGIYLGGFSWSENPETQFNWHPLLMTAGMVILYANSILIYRGFRQVRKKKLKYTHGFIHAMVFSFAVIALVAVFDSHNNATPPISNLYSLHSWIGLTAVILFACQFLIGFCVFLYPGLTLQSREVFLPVHVIFGLMGFIFAVIAALLGLSEKAYFRMKNLSELPNEAQLINCIGMLIIIFASFVIYLVTDRRYKRQPLADDIMLLTGNSE